jgi:hypothetical protein
VLSASAPLVAAAFVLLEAWGCCKRWRASCAVAGFVADVLVAAVRLALAAAARSAMLSTCSGGGGTEAGSDDCAVKASPPARPGRIGLYYSFAQLTGLEAAMCATCGPLLAGITFGSLSDLLSSYCKGRTYFL